MAEEMVTLINEGRSFVMQTRWFRMGTGRKVTKSWWDKNSSKYPNVKVNKPKIVRKSKVKTTTRPAGEAKSAAASPKTKQPEVKAKPIPRGSRKTEEK